VRAFFYVIGAKIIIIVVNIKYYALRLAAVSSNGVCILLIVLFGFVRKKI
jgi:hypothetical protein